jgi:hypothetical protein
MHTAGERQRWVPKDYKSGQFEDRSVLPEKELQKSMMKKYVNAFN